ncbi:hypothetical protein CYMTET_6245 [Cymbomonas tetramitiformis]|uniref:Uncharacterized protein n=1 Tax=Cymbomonas tetramitiformis TaxID=36881 RepID=A0AAE0GXU1_9CHLO|nr:hypothetical protein CYMTET_6245 [Cymbomonas tetramitiformis]
MFDLGPVREYWMYVFESYNGKIGRWVKNNAFPIQSIMNGIGRQDMIRFVRGLLMALRQEVPMPFHTKVITVDPVGVNNVGKNHNLTDLEQQRLTKWMRNNIQHYINLEELVENYNHLISKFGRVDDIYRVELGGRPYVLVKVSWLKKPTKALTAALRARHSIIGADSVSNCFYVLDPENPATEFDRKEPFMLAEEIASQVVIRKHPCMETSVVLDPLADFFEQIVRDENPSDDEA